MECFVCESTAEPFAPVTRDATGVRCSTCGDYEISGTAIAVLSHKSPHERLQAHRFAQTTAEAGRLPFIHG